MISQLEMSPSVIKAELHQVIDEIEDADILSAVYALLSKLNTAQENDLSVIEKKLVDQALDSKERGEGISHRSVMDEMKRTYPDLH